MQPSQEGRQPLPEPWDAPSYIVNRGEAPVTPRRYEQHHAFTTATSVDREHDKQQTRDKLVHQRRQEAADRVLRYAVDSKEYEREVRCATTACRFAALPQTAEAAASSPALRVCTAQARSATKQSLDVQRAQRDAVQEHDKRLTVSEDQRTLNHAVAQERNIQARHEARRSEQIDTANHNLQAIRAKEAAKQAQKQASLAQDRANNADCRESGCQRWQLRRPGSCVALACLRRVATCSRRHRALFAFL